MVDDLVPVERPVPIHPQICMHMWEDTFYP